MQSGINCFYDHFLKSIFLIINDMKIFFKGKLCVNLFYNFPIRAVQMMLLFCCSLSVV